MTDVLTLSQRKNCMSSIKSKDTKPEIALRKALWKRGFRYRVHYKLVGTPDIVFPGKRIAIFVDGCFWHRCPKHFVEPKNNSKFWTEKINGNVERDKKNNEILKSMGWMVLRLWEHEIKSSNHDFISKIEKEIKKLSDFL